MISRIGILLLWSILVQFCWGGPKNPAVYLIEQKNSDKNIALTFDDGPHGNLTPKLLDVLKELKVKVTFFVMGIKVAIHPDIVRRAHTEGHEIGNHGYET
jgi:peptidoglycan/xylan/chitin deacetylase (PgdA/CDA1 family)